MATTAGSTRINIDLALNTRGFRPLGRINGQLGEFEKSLDASNARVLVLLLELSLLSRKPLRLPLKPL